MGKFNVLFVCKPYVKRFLELNYGDPTAMQAGTVPCIDIFKDKRLYEAFRSKLDKKSFRYDGRFSNYGLKRYSEEVNIRISQDDFYRYGWELSWTDIVHLNKLLESKVKILMYTIVGSHVAFGKSLSESIDYFQENFMYPDEIWAKESLYKDCQRNLEIMKYSIAETISKNIDKICLVKLSENRTISHKMKTAYENNQI